MITIIETFQQLSQDGYVEALSIWDSFKWGTSYNDCDGYFYASEAFVEYKTMDIMLHKDAVPKNIKKKLGIK